MLIIFLEFLIAAAFLTNGILLLAGKSSFLFDPRYLEHVENKAAFRRGFGINFIVLGIFWILMSLVDTMGWLSGFPFALLYWSGIIVLVANLVRIYKKYKK